MALCLIPHDVWEMQHLNGSKYIIQYLIPHNTWENWHLNESKLKALCQADCHGFSFFVSIYLFTLSILSYFNTLQHTPYTVGNKTIWMFGSFGLCIEYIYFDLMVKILVIFQHILPHLSYIINQESRKLIGNFLRYNYFLPKVSFEWFCC